MKRSFESRNHQEHSRENRSHLKEALAKGALIGLTFGSLGPSSPVAPATSFDRPPAAPSDSHETHPSLEAQLRAAFEGAPTIDQAQIVPGTTHYEGTKRDIIDIRLSDPDGDKDDSTDTSDVDFDEEPSVHVVAIDGQEISPVGGIVKWTGNPTGKHIRLLPRWASFTNSKEVTMDYKLQLGATADNGADKLDAKYTLGDIMVTGKDGKLIHLDVKLPGNSNPLELTKEK